MNTQATEPECCPEFDPAKWDGKTFEWKDKLFIRDRVRTILHMPLNFGPVMRRMNQKVESAGASVPDWLCLSEHTSSWNMNLYLAVDKPVEKTEIVSLNGKFLFKVYEGPFRDAGKWIRDFQAYAGERDLKVDKQFMWYTTCPKCAKKYGKNPVAVVGQLQT